MAPHDPELDRLTELLGQCLGRIDEQAFRLQNGEGLLESDAIEQLEDGTTELQELVDALLIVPTASEETDLNGVVDQAVANCLQEIAMPIVLRKSLGTDLPNVPYTSSFVSVAVQRALLLAVRSLQPGGELVVTTRLHDGSALVEIAAHGCAGGGEGPSLVERTATLREFVTAQGGDCHTDRDQHDDVFVVLELPQAPAADRSESS